ncbi:MAG: right-handed parallel beta-helix repeat-containing protein [candidate division Zixibacteria bacterium]
MKKVIIIAIMTIIGFAASAFATIIDIPEDYPTIQQGIDASVDSDTVLVQPGTYVENINFNGHNIVLGSLFLTTGDTTYIGQTVIDGDSAGHVIEITSFEDSLTTISGFTIINGTFGGIYIRESNVSILNNIITRNSSGGWGGGIFLFNSSNSKIKNNIITENISDGYDGGAGGGICCWQSTIQLDSNFICYNIAEKRPLYDGVGGGIYLRNSTVSMFNNIISQNKSFAGGSGIYCLGSDNIDSYLDIVNCIFSNNHAQGIFLYRNVTTINNSIIWLNGGDEIVNFSQLTITYSDIEGGMGRYRKYR